MANAKLTFIDGGGRSGLNEGRNSGFGGAFCRRDGDTIKTVMPLTACADFYAEVIHAEITGKSWSVHNFSYSKQDIYDTKAGVAYMVCGILPVNHGGKYADYDRDLAALEANYTSLEKFINYFEEKFKLKKFTKITKLEDNRFLFTLPLFWCGGTYKISLYKSLSRIGIFYTGGCPMEYFEKFDKTNEDKYTYKTIQKKLEQMLSGHIPEQKMTVNDSCPHNLGIVSFQFPPAGELYKTDFPKMAAPNKEVVLNIKQPLKMQPMNF